jgi:predicted RNA polymerase sigma factor
LEALDALPPDCVSRYQPFWVARARVLKILGRSTEAAAAQQIAIGLTRDPAGRAFLKAEPTSQQ